MEQSENQPAATVTIPSQAEVTVKMQIIRADGTVEDVEEVITSVADEQQTRRLWRWIEGTPFEPIISKAIERGRQHGHDGSSDS